jgi:hypothetical protein
MQIENIAGFRLSKGLGRAMFSAGVILILLRCVPAAAQQGRGARTPDQSLPLVQ